MWFERTKACFARVIRVRNLIQADERRVRADNPGMEIRSGRTKACPARVIRVWNLIQADERKTRADNPGTRVRFRRTKEK